MPLSNNELLICEAKFAEQSERYEDMVKSMRKRAEVGGKLESEDRNLLSVAYKNVVSARRSAWRIVSAVESKKDEKQGIAKDYRITIEQELQERCRQVLTLIDDYLLPSLTDEKDDDESSVFYLKMKGDYLRYLVEVATGDDREKSAIDSKNAYEAATKKADNLAVTHPIRLGLALNFSVFHYEIMNEGRPACEIAKKAFDEAIAELDNLKEDSYKDSTLIMQLLRDNLTLWSSESNEEDGDDQ